MVKIVENEREVDDLFFDALQGKYGIIIGVILLPVSIGWFIWAFIAGFIWFYPVFLFFASVFAIVFGFFNYRYQQKRKRASEKRRKRKEGADKIDDPWSDR
jgi:predicted membrane protein